MNLPVADWARLEGGGRKAVARVVGAAMRLLRLGSSIPYQQMKSLVDENDKWVRGLGAAYERISCPVMLVLGSDADLVPQGAEIRDAVREGVRGLQDAHPHVSVEWLSCGHFIPLQRPAELTAKIESFVNQLT